MASCSDRKSLAPQRKGNSVIQVKNQTESTPLTAISAKKILEIKETKSYCFELKLGESNDKTYPEFSWIELVKNHEADPKTSPKKLNLDPYYSDDEEHLKALVAGFEKKYGNQDVGNNKRKKRQMIEDVIDRGAGYDESDSFIDNTDIYDEVVPTELQTAFGGFYINSGSLDFKEDSNPYTLDSCKEGNDTKTKSTPQTKLQLSSRSKGSVKSTELADILIAQSSSKPLVAQDCTDEILPSEPMHIEKLRFSSSSSSSSDSSSSDNDSSTSSKSTKSSESSLSKNRDGIVGKISTVPVPMLKRTSDNSEKSGITTKLPKADPPPEDRTDSEESKLKPLKKISHSQGLPKSKKEILPNFQLPESITITSTSFSGKRNRSPSSAKKAENTGKQITMSIASVATAGVNSSAPAHATSVSANVHGSSKSSNIVSVPSFSKPSSLPVTSTIDVSVSKSRCSEVQIFETDLKKGYSSKQLPAMPKLTPYPSKSKSRPSFVSSSLPDKMKGGSILIKSQPKRSRCRTKTSNYNLATNITKVPFISSPVISTRHGESLNTSKMINMPTSIIDTSLCSNVTGSGSVDVKKISKLGLGQPGPPSLSISEYQKMNQQSQYASSITMTEVKDKSRPLSVGSNVKSSTSNLFKQPLQAPFSTNMTSSVTITPTPSASKFNYNTAASGLLMSNSTSGMTKPKAFDMKSLLSNFSGRKRDNINSSDCPEK